jgi:hypothetical protein
MVYILNQKFHIPPFQAPPWSWGPSFKTEFFVLWGISFQGKCRECLLVQLSTERQYSGDSYFREQSFYSNKSTWHFSMDPNACLCYPSQPGVTQTFPQVSLTVRRLLSWWEGCIFAPGDPHSHLQCRSSSRFTGETQWSSGEGACSQAAAASTSGSWDRLRQRGLWWARRRARLWVLAWVYITCGDLTTSTLSP